MEDIIYYCIECYIIEVVCVFSEWGMNDKVKLFEFFGFIYIYYYILGGIVDYYYGNLFLSIGFIYLFDFVKYYDGLLLCIFNKENLFVLEDVVK